METARRAVRRCPPRAETASAHRRGRRDRRTPGARVGSSPSGRDGLPTPFVQYPVRTRAQCSAAIQWSDPHRARRYFRLAAYAQSQRALTVFAADPLMIAVPYTRAPARPARCPCTPSGAHRTAPQQARGPAPRHSHGVSPYASPWWRRSQRLVRRGLTVGHKGVFAVAPIENSLLLRNDSRWSGPVETAGIAEVGPPCPAVHARARRQKECEHGRPPDDEISG